MAKTLRRLFCCIVVCFLTCFILIHPAISDESANEEIPLNQYGIRSTNPYVVDRFIEDGKLIDEIIVPSMPHPPEGFISQVAMVPEPDIAAGTNTISNVPAMTWCFGCSATSAAMMFGHYDNSDYSNMYAGPTNGGVFPMTNATWGTVVINEETRALCPLSATRLDLDGRTNKGHVDDYWVKYGSSADDPFIGNWTEHTHGECTGDYMGTNQSSLDNTDGSTTFYNYTNGAPLYDYTGCEPSRRDGCHGLLLFAESRGYTVQSLGNFNQYIYGYDGNTQGFTFDDFKNEIDAGRPVLIQVEGHTMLGYGYNDTGSTIYIHDTWNYDDHEMTWGGSYSGMAHYGVGVLRLVAAAAAPTVTTTTVSLITSNSASSGGNVTANGGASVTARGVCWSTFANPTTSDSHTSDGTGTGSFNSSITGLRPGTTYHVSAYATNSVGTGYGSDRSFTTSGIPASVTRGDFNGDGKADILWRNDSSGEVYIWLMNGTSIGSQGSSGTVSDLNWKIQKVGDYTGDGKADILWRHQSTGEMSVWVMNGITRDSGGTPGWVTTDWQIKDVGDFNGDGKADILWRNDSSGEVYIWLMNGTSIGLQGSSGTVSDLNWKIQFVGDFTGDGKADILWRHNSTGELSVWVMDGITRLSGGTPGWVTTDWQVKDVGDFNGDGKADFLWRNVNSGQVYIWLMNGTSIGSQGSSGTVSDLNWTIQKVGDFTGDSKADILWRHQSTGEMSVWVMDGITRLSGGTPGWVTTDWQIK